MRSKLLWGLAATAVVLGAVAHVGKVQATPAAAFTGQTIALGRFTEINTMNVAVMNTSNRALLPDGNGPGRPAAMHLWLSMQKTKGVSDVYVQSNTWGPWGTTGWHTHPGHSLIIVTAGKVTVYEGTDPECRPRVYTAGMGFVDEGGDHVHLIRNEDAIEARTVAVQVIPAGATRRIDADANPHCRF